MTEDKYPIIRIRVNAAQKKKFHDNKLSGAIRKWLDNYKPKLTRKEEK